jgi:hypothetical protein
MNNKLLSKSYIIIVISLQKTFLCKLKFKDENNITCITFLSCLFLVFILVLIYIYRNTLRDDDYTLRGEHLKK